MIRPAKDMSFVPTVTSAAFAKDRMIGKSDALANSGASSTMVYNISDLEVSDMFFHLSNLTGAWVLGVRS
jgi:hypothetical protein